MLKHTPFLVPFFAVSMIAAAPMPTLAQSVDSTAATERGSGKGAIVAGAPVYPAACVEYVAEYMGCLNYSDPLEGQAGTAGGYPLVVEARTERKGLALQPSEVPDRDLRPSRIASPRH
jgi:hypothetical protein